MAAFSSSSSSSAPSFAPSPKFVPTKLLELFVNPTQLSELVTAELRFINFFMQNINRRQFLRFIQALLDIPSTSTIFFTGIGNSGFVARKTSQTLNSFGLGSSFLFPSDDISVLKRSDVLVIFCECGTTEQILRMVLPAKAKGVYLISVTSAEEGNVLASACDLNVHLPLDCSEPPYDRDFMVSVVVQMVFGDMVAIMLMGAKALLLEETEGNDLIHKVKGVIKNVEELPISKETDLILDQLVELTSKISQPVVNPTGLVDLFKSQETYINFFLESPKCPDIFYEFPQVILNANPARKIFFTGVGNSGLVAQNISNILISLGFNSGFLSPGDDTEFLDRNDVLFLLCNSGNTEDFKKLVLHLRTKGLRLISVTFSERNTLASLCGRNVHLPLEMTLYTYKLAPVASIVIQMVFGDILATTCMVARGLVMKEYVEKDYPAERIGKSLLFKVKDITGKQKEFPVCNQSEMIVDHLSNLKRVGCILVGDDHGHLVGTFSEADLMETFSRGQVGVILVSTVGDLCNRYIRTIDPEATAAEAIQRMESPPTPVKFLPVVNHENHVVGIVSLHDLVSAAL